ncbi:hypothetical protein BJV82DRAFT_604984 [Fennellomyces sp. T-0311]|nr:hypothetical protein BJV82DRAFT_604984 [Fennellomyces sp. T-0311]
MLLNNAREDSFFSITDCSGRQVNLLNNEKSTDHAGTSKPVKKTFPSPIIANQWHSNVTKSSNKRRHHCSECQKSFTTSGHLARHNRVHTGEKNFPCLFPGCQSRFSRQDNMMQHYRTHMSPRSRRSHRRNSATATTPVPAVSIDRPKPKLHAHHRISSGPFQVERPLTIDQHLSNYHRSLPSIQHMTTTRGLGPTTTTFYRHRPLTYSNDAKTGTSTTLLGPSMQLPELKKDQDAKQELVKLTHIVSTFG